MAPQKTGTHLVQELALQARYRIVGATRPAPNNLPAFTRAEQVRMVEQVFGPDRAAQFHTARQDFDIARQDFDTAPQDLDTAPQDFDITTQADLDAVCGQAWDAIRWTWYRRFGQPVVNRYGADKLERLRPPHQRDSSGLDSMPFADTPAGLCWIWHELDITAVDGQFIGEWSDRASPPIVLNYRDPRDALISLIHFLEGGTGRGFGNFYERRAYSKVIGNLPTMADKVSYALDDPYFPAATEFEKSLWLLAHPDVCTVRYEDLVGPNGGGSAAAQHDAVDRVLRHLGDEKTDAAEVAARIYNPDSWSFRSGRTGEWRSVFSTRHTDQFRDRYGTVLDRYGYS